MNLDPSPEALTELQTQRGRLLDPYAAQRIWQRLLSQAERDRWDNKLEDAYRDGGTLGMWMRVHDVSEARAVVDLAHGLGFLTDKNADWLLRELGEQPRQNHEIAASLPLLPPEPADELPRWDRDNYELWYRDEVVRRILLPDKAENIVRVLNAFQEEGWPRRIDDPLPRRRDQHRVHQTVRSLNSGLRLIRFHSDGTGEGITWREVGQGTV